MTCVGILEGKEFAFEIEKTDAALWAKAAEVLGVPADQLECASPEKGVEVFTPEAGGPEFWVYPDAHPVEECIHTEHTGSGYYVWVHWEKLKVKSPYIQKALASMGYEVDAEVTSTSILNVFQNAPKWSFWQESATEGVRRSPFNTLWGVLPKWDGVEKKGWCRVPYHRVCTGTCGDHGANRLLSVLTIFAQKGTFRVRCLHWAKGDPESVLLPAKGIEPINGTYCFTGLETVPWDSPYWFELATMQSVILEFIPEVK